MVIFFKEHYFWIHWNFLSNSSLLKSNNIGLISSLVVAGNPGLSWYILVFFCSWAWYLHRLSASRWRIWFLISISDASEQSNSTAPIVVFHFQNSFPYRLSNCNLKIALQFIYHFICKTTLSSKRFTIGKRSLISTFRFSQPTTLSLLNVTNTFKFFYWFLWIYIYFWYFWKWFWISITQIINASPIPFFLTLGNIQLGQQSPLGQLILCDFYQLWSWVEISSSFSSEISLLALPKFEIIYSFLYGLDKQCVSPDHLILRFLLYSLNCNPFSAMSHHMKH